VSEPGTTRRDPFWWHLPLVLAVSAFWESLFLHRGINKLDEGWPLYAAMQLAQGGRLYDDILWVFPPGHVLPAWIGYTLDPPGFGLTRLIYAAFAVALCGALYVLGRRIMPPRFALLGALLLAVAASRSHPMHLLFGYRYLVLTVLGLLAFARRLDTGDRRLTFVAGLLGGLTLVFRLTPAFAFSCAIAVGAVAADPRRFWRDWLAYGAGLLLVAGPVVAYFSWSVGFLRFADAVVVWPLAMLQPLPMPEIDFPSTLSRLKFEVWFVAVQFRLYLALYAAYAVALVALWVKAGREGRRFEHALLLTVVVWGGVFYIRSLGRSDEAHLDSALPPVCLMMAHALYVGIRRLSSVPARRRAEVAAWVGMFAMWFFLAGNHAPLAAGWKQGDRLEIPGEEIYVSPNMARRLNLRLRLLREITEPGERILDLSSSPFWHVMTGRPGYGEYDVVMPGTFRTPAEEQRFLRRVRQLPPAAVIWPRWVFDRMLERSIAVTAPRLVQWVNLHYRDVGYGPRYVILAPKDPAFRERSRARAAGGDGAER